MNTFGGKMKALTFSYDDGTTQDRRLVEILNRYNLKCTFNISSGLFEQEWTVTEDGKSAPHIKLPKSELPGLYDGHEVAAHGVTHVQLTRCDDAEVIRQVEQDRLALSDIMGYEVVGFAYPGGGISDHVVDLLQKNTGIRYGRTVFSTQSTGLQTDNLLKFNPTLNHRHEIDLMFEMGQKFLDSTPDEPQLFYIWGHAYEFDMEQTWERFEEFCRMMSGRGDIFYGTNKEVLL